MYIYAAIFLKLKPKDRTLIELVLTFFSTPQI